MTPVAAAFLAIDGRLTVIEAAATDRAWADRVLAERPETRLHRVPHRGSATTGLADHGGVPSLDRALAELGVKHLNYLRIADPDAALAVLVGARGILSHARIDMVEIAGGTTATRSTAAIAALLEPFDFMLLPPS